MTGERFREIYRKERWGRGKGSGDGSDPKYSAVWIEYVQGLIDSGEYRSVLDVGCGDLRMLNALRLPDDVSYWGVDVAMTEKNLVEAQRRNDNLPPNAGLIFSDVTIPGTLAWLSRNTSFDLVLIKDVLQHLSDEEVMVISNDLSTLSWKTVLVANDWRFVRDPKKNTLRRDVNNPYSWSAISYNHYTLKPLGLREIAYYPRNRRKQIARADRETKT